MLDPLETENRPLLEALHRGRRKAWFVILIEQITLHFWRPGLWILLFTALWILEIPQFFGMNGQIGGLAVFIAGLVYLFRRDILTMPIPDPASVDLRLEKSSRFRRGQIRALEDRLANPHKRETRELWDKGQRQMLSTLPGLQTPAPRSFLASRDPRALRFAVVLLFVSAILVAGADWQRRMWNGLFPVTPSFILSQGRKDELWIKPPEYTAQPQLHINGSALAEPVKIPEGSEVKIRVFSSLGTFAPPYYNMGGKSAPLNHLGDGLFGLETKIEPGKDITVTQMLMTRADWDYEYLIDQPPTMKFDEKKEEEKDQNNKNESEKSAQGETGDGEPLTDLNKQKAQEEKPDENAPSPLVDESFPPLPGPELRQAKKEEKAPYEILQNNQIRFAFIVQDDYAVTDLTMGMRLDDMVTEKPRGENAHDERVVMSAPGKELKVQPIYDLTGHTWAGLPVVFEFSVKDHKGQTAKVTPVRMTLPERTFKHPVAKLLIALRKKLAWSTGRDFSDIAANLEAMLQAPDLFHNDMVVYLAIKTASARLTYARISEPEEVEKTAVDLIKLLWETALSIEDGNLSVAMRDLRQAQKELENALRDPNASEEDIARLMDNLRESMMQYYIELSREMEKRMQEGQDTPEINPDDLAKMINPESLADMMDRMESELRSGNRDSAKELLSQLQNMLDLMDPSMESPLPEDMQMAMEGINELQQLIESQEKLRDQTSEQANRQKFNQGTSQGFADPIPFDEKAMGDLGLSQMPPSPNMLPPPPAQPEQEQSGPVGPQVKTPEQNPETESGPAPSEEADTSSPEERPEQERATNEDGAASGEESIADGPPADISGESAEAKADPADSRPNKAEQEALRYILGSLMLESADKLEQVPEGMGKAELEMRGSSGRLEENKPAESIPHQDLAIKYLKEAQEQLQKTLSQRMQQMTGLGFNGAQKYDPLGRPYGGEDEANGPHHGSQVKIPDEAEKKRVEEILKELRRRSGEMERPPEEREYYRRLLRQF